MDINELFHRHQVALIDMTNAPSAPARRWAEACADYYADRIDDLRHRSGIVVSTSHDAMKGMMRA